MLPTTGSPVAVMVVAAVVVVVVVGVVKRVVRARARERESAAGVHRGLCSLCETEVL